MQGNSELMTLSQLPPGSVQLPRQGKPLTGWELGEGLVNLVRQAGLDETDLVIKLAGEWWNREHLTFPRASVRWVASATGIWLILRLMGEKEFTWSRGEWPDGGLTVVGPCERPDDLREGLGLPIVVKFRTPGDAVVSVAVVEGQVESASAAVSEKVVEPVSGAEPVVVTVETPLEELVGEPPRAPLVNRSVEPLKVAPKPQGAQLLKGVRK